MKTIRCVLHGSFQKHFKEIQKVRELFIEYGIEVLAPRETEITSLEDGFVRFEGEEGRDPRTIELLYLHHVKRLGKEGFSYFETRG